MAEEEIKQKNIPIWLAVTLVLLFIAGGAWFVRWYFRDGPESGIIVIPPTAQEEALADRKAKRPRQQPAPSKSKPAATNAKPASPTTKPAASNNNTRSLAANNTAPAAAIAPATNETSGSFKTSIIEYDPSPTLITLHLKNVPPKTVFDELTKQAGIEFQSRDNDLWEQSRWPAVVMDMDIEGQNFWSAMREISARTGIEPQNQHNFKGIDLTRSSEHWISDDHPIIISGPIMLGVQSITRSSRINPSQPQSPQHQCYLKFALFLEPKLTVVESSRIEIIEALDEKENSLLAGTKKRRNLSIYPADGWFCTQQVLLDYPQNAGRRITRLKGLVHFTVQTKVHKLEASNLFTNPIDQTIAGYDIHIDPIQKKGAMYVVPISIARGGRDDKQWQEAQRQLNFLLTRLKLLDAQGRSLQFGAWGGGGSDDPITRDIRFSIPKRSEGSSTPGEPATLVWELPLETQEIQVPFEFADLPLP